MQYTLAEQLRTALDRSGYTYKEVSEHTGLSTHAIRGVFQGKAYFYSVMKIWEFLNLDVDASKLNEK